jgi:xylan 1,4-beta-xylosidase
MFGLLGQERVAATSSGALQSAQILASGVRDASDVNALATRRGRNETTILLWNYHDDDLPAPAAQVNLLVGELPNGISRALVEHFRVDAEHSNSYTEWKRMSSPPSPSPAEYMKLEAAGQLQLLESPWWQVIEGGTLQLRFVMPRQSLSLVRISW